MEFAILGPLEVRSGGRVLRLGSVKQRSVLAILLIHAGEVVSTDRLVDELWSGSPPRSAVKALQMHVSGLRRALASADLSTAPRLETRAPGYFLRVEPGELDLHRFERLTAEGRRAASEAHPARAARLLREALALWRGPPLADLAYESFAQAEAGRLEELRLAALEERLGADLELGRHAELVAELEALVADHPLRERLRGQLMLALYRSGRQAEALDAYREARRLLVEELGIEPGEELRHLERAVLTHDPSIAAPPMRGQAPARDSAKGAAPSRAPGPRKDFVGREEELGELLAGLNEAFEGRGSLFLVAGEPGIGKSRLADEFARRARERGAATAWGRCWEAGGAPAYWPWVQALRSLVRDRQRELLLEELGAGGPNVAQLVPELEPLFPPVGTATEDPEAARFRLFDSVTAFLRRAGGAEPIVVVLDDVHVADDPSLLMLRFLAAELADARVLVYAAYRDTDLRAGDPLSRTLAELVRAPVTRLLQLGGLRQQDVVRFIEVAGFSPSDEVAAAIHAKTEGNALFVRETVRLLASERRLSDSTAVAAATVPEGVREAIARRLEKLPRECRRVLSLGAVLGREFDLAPLEQIARASREESLALLDHAVRAGVIEELPGNPERLRFSHALVRDALYSELGAAERLRLHLQAGESLESLYGGDPDPQLAQLAHHFCAAGPAGHPDKALAYARRAADRALAMLAHEEAARLYELALRVLDTVRPARAGERCELLLSLGHALAGAGRAEESKRSFLQAADVAAKHGMTEYAARAALGYGGRYVWMAARGDRHLVPLLEGALEGLPPGDSSLRVRCMARLAGALRDQPSRDRRAAFSEAALEMARRLGDRETLAYALDARITAMAAPDHSREQIAIATEAVHLAEQAGAPERAFFGQVYRLLALFDLGDMAGVAAALAASSRIADDLREPAYRWGVEVIRAQLALFEGRFAQAEERMDTALAHGRRSQSWSAVMAHTLQLFQLRKQRGGLETLEEPLRRAAEENPSYPILRCALASLHAELELETEARAVFETLAPNGFEAVPFNEEWLVGLGLLAEVAHFLGDTRRAATLYKRLEPYADRNAVSYPEISTGSVARQLALLAAAAGRPAAARRHFEAAIARNTAMGAHPWIAQAEHGYAALLAEEDAPEDRDLARRLLARARERYTRLGMRPYLERASALQPAPAAGESATP